MRTKSLVLTAFLCSFSVSLGSSRPQRVYGELVPELSRGERPAAMQLITVHDSFEEGIYDLCIEALYPGRRRPVRHRLTRNIRRDVEKGILYVEGRQGARQPVADILPASLERRYEGYELLPGVELGSERGWVFLSYRPAPEGDGWLMID